LDGDGLRGTTRLVGPLQEIRSRRPVLLLCSLTLLMCCLIFPSVGWWPLAYVCLVPWLICVCASARPRLLYVASYLLGLAFFLINVHWMRFCTLPGYLAICAIYGAAFPLTAWPIRYVYRSRGLSVAIVAPIAWVAVEYLRSIGPLGFPWLLMAHSQYELLTVIQISDLAGAYGVSFMLVMVNGWITDLLIQPILMVPAGAAAPLGHSAKTARLPIGSLATLLVVLGTLIYGGAQRSEHLLKPGPKIAVVQHDIPMYVDPPPGRSLSPDTVLGAHLALARRAAAEKPDLIVLPETVVPSYINAEFLGADREMLDEIRQRRYPTAQVADLQWYQRYGIRVRDAFQGLSDQTGVPILLGASSLSCQPTSNPPRVDAYNSAFLLEPGQSVPAARYDKRHLVLFGEYVPFRDSYPAIYNWLNGLTPWGRNGGHYSLTAGDAYVVSTFNAASMGDQPCRAGTPICYEEIMPYIARDFTRGDGASRGRKNANVLLSISNDGWFLHSSELEQHLAAAVFRAVENRIAVARSVNTGTSALVYPNGKIHRRVMLSDEQITRLDDSTSALEHLRGAAMELQRQQADDNAYRQTLRSLNEKLMVDLQKSVATLGEEFLFIFNRLDRLRGQLVAGNPDMRRAAIGIFLGQIDDDLATIQRWRNRPWTAPGYVIDNARFDSRLTLYTRWGDWFALAALGLTGLMLLDWLRHRLGGRSSAARAKRKG
jgi:apolipoprotein N-acyltransferase